MGTVADSLTVIRSLVRDEDELVFTNLGLLRLYNNARRILFRETEMRARATVMQIPAWKEYGVTQFWEQSFCARSWWIPFFRGSVPDWFPGGGAFTCTQPWEVEQLLEGTASTAGGYCVTCPFEGSLVSTTRMAEYRLPEDCERLIWVGYCGEKIEQKAHKFIANYDSEYRSRQGEPIWFTLEGPMNRGFLPYPQPITASAFVPESPWEVDAEDGDQEASVADGFTLFFVSLPADVSDTSEEDWRLPRPFRKYVEWLASSMALRAETELRDDKKASFLTQRYKFGVSLIGELKGHLRRDLRIDKRMLGGVNRSQLGRPRFPEHYPPAWT